MFKIPYLKIQGAMATQNSNINFIQLQSTYFKGKKYALWSIKMKIPIIYHNLWDLIEIRHPFPTNPLT